MREFIRLIRNPTIKESNKWFEWVAVITLTTCVRCIYLNLTHIKKTKKEKVKL